MEKKCRKASWSNLYSKLVVRKCGVSVCIQKSSLLGRHFLLARLCVTKNSKLLGVPSINKKV